MSKLLIFVTYSLILSLAGCSSVAIYPVYKDTVKVSISAEALSSWSEVPAGASLVEDSQVIVTGRGGTNELPILLGIVGIAIQKGLNSSSISDAKQNYKIKFDSEFYEAFQRNSSRQPYASRYKFSILKSNKLEDIWLRPAAWFLIKDNSQAFLLFQVVARFIDESGNKHSKMYWSRNEILPLSGSGGWSDDNAKLFKQATSRSLERIAQVILLDMVGECSKEGQYDKQPQIQWKPLDEDKPIKSNLLCEQPDYFVTNMWGNSVVVVDRVLEPIISKN